MVLAEVRQLRPIRRLENLFKRDESIPSFSSNLYSRLKDEDYDKDLEDFFVGEHETTMVEEGLEKTIRLSIKDSLRTNDLEKFGLNRDEVIEVLKFLYAYMDFSHQDVKRKSGLPYSIHPKTVAINVAKYGVSWKAVAASIIHDVVEERLKKDVKKNDPFRKNKEMTIYYSIGLELYNFVRNSGKIRDENRHKFYEGVNVIMLIVDNLTNIGGGDYIEYLRNKVFYRRPITNVGQSLLKSTPELILPFLGDFEGVSDKERFVRDYMRDVHNINFWRRGKDDEMERTRRRTIHAKLSDMATNISDMPPKYEIGKGGFDVTFRLAEYFKGTLLAHETGLKEHKLHKSEYFKRIMDQCAELRNAILKEVEKDIDHYKNVILADDKEYIEFAEHFMDYYDRFTGTRGMKSLTQPNKVKDIEAAFEEFKKWKRDEIPSIDRKNYEKGNLFDGTLIKYTIALLEGDGNPYQGRRHSLSVSRSIFADLLVMRRNVIRANEFYSKHGRVETVYGFSLDTLSKKYGKEKSKAGR